MGISKSDQKNLEDALVTWMPYYWKAPQADRETLMRVMEVFSTKWEDDAQHGTK